MHRVRNNITVSRDALVKFLQLQDKNCSPDFSDKFEMISLTDSVVFQWTEEYKPSADSKPKRAPKEKQQPQKKVEKLAPSSVTIG